MSRNGPEILKNILIAAFLFAAACIFISCAMFQATETRVEVELPVCSTNECHTDIKVKKYVHMPVRKGACIMCHKLIAKKHPSENNDIVEFEIWGEDVAICYVCHERKDNKKVVHRPVMTGECSSCHDPHQSDYPMRLKENTNKEICYSCHKRFSEKLKSSPYIHTPVKSGECFDCHDAHSTDNDNLLKKPYPEKISLPFDIKNYALCFSCHDQNMVLIPKSVIVTNFRNGEVNLHFVHVNREPSGRTCGACHFPHASTQPKNIRYFESNMPKSLSMTDIKYEKTEDGGSCKVKCHAMRAYDRLTPVENK